MERKKILAKPYGKKLTELKKQQQKDLENMEEKINTPPPIQKKFNPAALKQNALKKSNDNKLLFEILIPEIVLMESDEDLIDALVNQLKGIETSFSKKLVHDFSPKMIRDFLTKYLEQNNRDIISFYNAYIKNEDIITQMSEYAIIQEQKDAEDYKNRENEKKSYDKILNTSILNNIAVQDISRKYILNGLESMEGIFPDKNMNKKIDKMLESIVKNSLQNKNTYYRNDDSMTVFKIFVFNVGRVVDYIEKDANSFVNNDYANFLNLVNLSDQVDGQFLDNFLTEFIEKLKERKMSKASKVEKYNAENGDELNTDIKDKYKYLKKYDENTGEDFIPGNVKKDDRKTDILNKPTRKINIKEIDGEKKIEFSTEEITERREKKMMKRILKLENSEFTEEIRNVLIRELQNYPDVVEYIKKVNINNSNILNIIGLVKKINEKAHTVSEIVYNVSSKLLNYDEFLEDNFLEENINEIYNFLIMLIYKVENPTEHFFVIKKYRPLDINVNETSRREIKKIRKEFEEQKLIVKDMKKNKEKNNPNYEQELKDAKKKLKMLEMKSINMTEEEIVARDLANAIEELEYRLKNNQINEMDKQIKKLKERGEDFSELSSILKKEAEEQANLFKEIVRLKNRKREIETLKFKSSLPDQKMVQFKDMLDTTNKQEVLKMRSLSPSWVKPLPEDDAIRRELERKNIPDVVESKIEDIEDEEDNEDEIEQADDVEQYKNNKISELQDKMSEDVRVIDEKIGELNGQFKEQVGEWRQDSAENQHNLSILNEIKELEKEKAKIKMRYGAEIKNIRDDKNIVVEKDGKISFNVKAVVNKIDEEITNLLKRKFESTEPDYSEDENDDEDEDDESEDDGEVRCEKCFDRIASSDPFLQTFVGRNKVRFCSIDCFERYSFKKKKKSKK